MSRIRGVSETAAQPMITVWCGKGQHNAKIASQALVGLIQRQGCEACREREFIIESEEQRMARESSKADKELATREKDEEEAFQGNLPGTLPPDRVEIPEIEAAAVALDRAKTKATKAGVTKKDCNDTLDGLMKHYKLAEYVLADGRFVRPRGELHFDVVKEETGRREEGAGRGAEGWRGRRIAFRRTHQTCKTLPKYAKNLK
jgi:hypothetical protein